MRGRHGQKAEKDSGFHPTPGAALDIYRSRGELIAPSTTDDGRTRCKSHPNAISHSLHYPHAMHRRPCSGAKGKGGFGGRGFGGSGGKGKGKGRVEEGPPDSVVVMGEFQHSCEGDLIVKSTNEKVAHHPSGHTSG